MHNHAALIEEVFGKGCNLYDDVLKCSKEADKAQLRKAYYRTALKVHPDKNPNNPQAARSFQALSLAYQILQNAELRHEYDTTGVIPHMDDDDEEGDENTAEKDGIHAWKEYFDRIFGKVTVSKIDDFCQKYKCSDEERRDVLKEFRNQKGNLVKMLEFVMLSEPRDAVRWVDDYIRPAILEEEKETKQQNEDDAETKTTKRTSKKRARDETTTKKNLAPYKDAMEKSLRKIQQKIDKETAAERKKQQQTAAAAAEAENDENSDEDTITTETDNSEEEEDDDEEEEPRSASKTKKTTPSSRKRRKTNQSTPVPSSSTTKKKGKSAHSSSKKGKTKKQNNNNNNKKENNMDDLIAAIQNKNRGGGGANVLADLGSRYGVSMNADDDPLNDQEFAKAQAKMESKRKRR